MATTSLKLPGDLKERACSVARARGISTHAFLVEAVRHATVAAEQRAAFLADAEAARNQVHDSGMGYPADEVHTYIRAKAQGARTRRPKAKSWRA